jgi:hypothetical protein
MAVVINEFEVVPAESPQSDRTASPSQSQAESAPQTREIERMIEKEHERCERVWAH